MNDVGKGFRKDKDLGILRFNLSFFWDNESDFGGSF